MHKSRILAASLVLIALAGMAAACSTTSPGARPDDMSAAEHERTAAEKKAEADREAGAYDPYAIAVRPGGPGVRGADIGRTYNPTAVHKYNAQRAAEHARQHADAANVLTAAEVEACKEAGAGANTACPFEGSIAGYVSTAEGERLLPAVGEKPEAVLARVNCHLAHARTVGWKGMDGCPLYLKGLRAQLSQDGAAVDLVADSPESHRALEQALEGVFDPPTP